MDIFYAIDDNFVPQLAASVCSVCENHSRYGDINFHIFSMGISISNQDSLAGFVRSYGHGIMFHDISSFMDKIGFGFDTGGWNEVILARLLMSEFLSSDLHRIIYLDADTLILGDIATLWNQDLAGKTLGMVCEPTADRIRRTNLGIGDYKYCNSGVLLVDLDNWRSFDWQDKILAYCRENADYLLASDQDALNVVLKDDIAILSPRFNYSNVFDYYPYIFLNKLMPGFATLEDYSESGQHPVVVHFLGEERPWREGNTHRFSAEYHFYLEKTPWANAKCESGWSLYFAVWRIFNTITMPFPQIRYVIINSLIPAFMKYRAAKRRASHPLK